MVREIRNLFGLSPLLRSYLGRKVQMPPQSYINGDQRYYSSPSHFSQSNLEVLLKIPTFIRIQHTCHCLLPKPAFYKFFEAIKQKLDSKVTIFNQNEKGNALDSPERVMGMVETE